MSDPLGDRQAWEKRSYEPAIRRVPERRDQFETVSGLPVAALYDDSTVDPDRSQRLGFPGEFPFTRGVQPTMYRGRLWTMRQYAGYASAEESNQRYHFLLAQGQTGISVAFDLPTQMGYDPDHPFAEGEVGRVGVSISTLNDMDRLLDRLPLDRISVSMTINATAPILLAMYVAVAKRRGVPLESISGTVQNDILKEYLARGTYIYPPGPGMRLVTDLIAYSAQQLPRWNPISISGYHIREAGSTAVEELAFTIANGIAYVEHALERGLDIDAFAPHLSFFFNSHNDFFEEIAKFRAARRIWATLMRERFGAKTAAAQMLRFHAQTAGSSLTAQQPENNIVRTTLQALAAVLGGCQSLHTNSLDEALSLPTERSAQIALRTQQIIANESGVASTVDPLGGSYFIESLTDRVEAEARRLLDEIDSIGGALKALEVGYFQARVAESAYQYQRKVERQDLIIVGVNQFTTEETIPIDLTRVNPTVVDAQVERLNAVKRSRDWDTARRSLADLASAAHGSDNLIGPIITCVEQGCTLGEISDALRGVFGVYRQG